MNTNSIKLRQRQFTSIIKNIARSLSFGIVALTLAAQVHAQEAGYIDFNDLSSTYGEAKVEINLSKALIGMVGAFSQEEDPEVAEMLEKIQSITVRVYNLEGKPSVAFSTITEVTKKIRALKWKPIVSVNQENEKVRIFTKTTNGIMDGLVVMAVDEKGPGEAVFINIVGQIDPAKISKITKSLDIDVGEPK